MALSDIKKEDLMAIVEEALDRPDSVNHDEYVEISAQAMRDGHRGGVPWTLDLIKMLARSVARARQP